MSSSTTIRLATRGSALALWQANRIGDLIRQRQPHLTTENIIVSTRPDRHQDMSLQRLGGDKGLFVKEVEDAVLQGRADAAVHSLKDVPVEADSRGLALVAFPERADPRDVLVTRQGCRLATLPPGSTVATSAPRRQAQLVALRPDLKTCDVRGNVETRLQKLQEGLFDGIILAAAGLQRLNLMDRATEIFDPEVFVPAPGQGILAVQAPPDSRWADLWSAIDNPGTRVQAEVERQYSRLIGADCHTAAGCYLALTDQQARLTACLYPPGDTNHYHRSVPCSLDQILYELEQTIREFQTTKS